MCEVRSGLVGCWWELGESERRGRVGARVSLNRNSCCGVSAGRAQTARVLPLARRLGPHAIRVVWLLSPPRNYCFAVHHIPANNGTLSSFCRSSEVWFLYSQHFDAPNGGTSALFTYSSLLPKTLLRNAKLT